MNWEVCTDAKNDHSEGIVNGRLDPLGWEKAIKRLNASRNIDRRERKSIGEEK